MNTGNIYQIGDTKFIITKIEKELIHWVSFDSENSSGVFAFKTRLIKNTCKDCYGEYDCDYCNNTGIILKHISGMDEAKFIATSVKDFIDDKIKNIFK